MAEQQSQNAVRYLPATWRDTMAVHELEKLSFAMDAWPLIELIYVLGAPGVDRWKAMLDKKLVGFIATDIRAKQRLAWIATIAVHPDHRGQGIGDKLIGLAEEHCGQPRMRLTVRASNFTAQALYHRRDYFQVDVWPRYYVDKEDAIVMEKLLG
jgi:ribosomal protein S18 acetylase RimI-like enzyme